MFDWFKKKEKVKEAEPQSAFASDLLSAKPRSEIVRNALSRTFQRTVEDFKATIPGVAMDQNIQNVKAQFSSSFQSISSQQLEWFSGQGFIGYQACAMLAQNWLICKACEMPAEDAIRNGYEVTVNSGEDIAPEVLEAIVEKDIEYQINSNLLEFVTMGRTYGIRIAMFKVESDDPDYYFKPFNIDGVTPGSYKGISQVDPYWMTPELDGEAAADPSSIYFFEPTWWRVGAKRIHRTHLVIIRTSEVPDILKPTYYYGGISIPQKIFNRVYQAEQTANEAPLLAMTKRSTIIQVDLTQALSQQEAFQQRMAQWAFLRDNYAIKAIGLKETAQEFDTSLADLDAVIMTQYQLVAAAANVPAVKLLGTSPKGFNTTGEFEESNYHEYLESIQSHYLTPLLQRHHELLIASEIAPQFGIEPFATKIVWESLDSMTAKEKAEVNKIEADTGAVLISSGAIDSQEERERIINCPNSGYNGINLETVIADPEETDTEEPDLEKSPWENQY